MLVIGPFEAWVKLDRQPPVSFTSASPDVALAFVAATVAANPETEEYFVHGRSEQGDIITILQSGPPQDNLDEFLDEIERDSY